MEKEEKNNVEDTSNSKRTAMYWHRVYGEAITANFLQEWPEDQLPFITYVGEFTDEEWREFISKAHPDETGALKLDTNDSLEAEHSTEDLAVEEV